MPRYTSSPKAPGVQEKLDTIPVTVNRKDLVCPKCGSKMKLLEGTWGRFYGCVTWRATGCRGAISAHFNGAPKYADAPAPQPEAKGIWARLADDDLIEA